MISLRPMIHFGLASFAFSSNCQTAFVGAHQRRRCALLHPHLNLGKEGWIASRTSFFYLSFSLFHIHFSRLTKWRLDNRQPESSKTTADNIRRDHQWQNNLQKVVVSSFFSHFSMHWQKRVRGKRCHQFIAKEC